MIPRHFARAAAILLALHALAPGDAVAEGSARPYVGVQAGLSFWPAYSNRDEVEADTGPGYAVSFLMGLRAERPGRPAPGTHAPTRLLDRLGGRLEVEVGQRWSPIHGINDGPLQLTGDGKFLRATSVQLGLWPSWQVARTWRVYAGGGGGGTWIRALGSDKRVWSGQAGVGVLVDVPLGRLPARIDIGWRSFFANSTKLRDAMADYDAHGLVIGVHLGL